MALAVAASLATALALNVLVASVQGAAREILEGLVMLAASGVLFYVSYWLISQLEAKRWMDFLKQQARRGLELGGQGTLALTAFLAVYREGAETSLMYQALLGSEGRTRPGFLGLAAGLALGLVLLAVIAVLIRATTVRLPLRTFFKFSGLFLFALAIVFAGNGVFELQNAGILLTTNLAWLGRGLPWAGLYPNLQVISVQGLLLAGAILAWLLMPRTSLGTGAAGGCLNSAKLRGRITVNQRWAGPIVVVLILGGVILILALNLNLKGRNPGSAIPPARCQLRWLRLPPESCAAPADFREYPIGEEVEKNQMRIAAVCLPPVKMEGMADPSSSGLIHLEADIHATEGNRNGFAKDEFVPYLLVHYTIVPARSEGEIRRADPGRR